MTAEAEPVDVFDRIVAGGIDGEGREIGRIYAKQRGRYAVYSTIERVHVLFATEDALQRLQRRRLAGLACLRSEIDGALAPWRQANGQERRRSSTRAYAAQTYDGRIAAALVESLEGGVDNARRILRAVKAEIACERASRAQLYYLLSTMAVAIPMVVLGSYVYAHGSISGPFARPVWLAVTAGVIGTVYSMALSLRQRDVTNDRRRFDHLVDASVRICLGAIAGFIVAQFLQLGVLQLRIGNAALPDAAGGASASLVIIAGFLAGFAERFVPDLLSTYAGDDHAAPAELPATTTDKAAASKTDETSTEPAEPSVVEPSVVEPPASETRVVDLR